MSAGAKDCNDETRTRVRSAMGRPLLIAVMVASGFAGLGYQLVWARLFAVSLGHEIAAVLAVVTAFFSGLALGAWLSSLPQVRRIPPRRLYVLLEIVIAAWVLVLVFAVEPYNACIARLIGVDAAAPWQWVVAFVATFLLLLPATAAMGATLPAMERLFSQRFADRRSVAGLYAANTFGAVLGTLLTTYVIAPLAGFTPTLILLLSVNVLCAVVVLRLREPHRAVQAAPATIDSDVMRYAIDEGWRRSTLAATLFLTGLLGIGYEVVIIRILSQQLENTVYTFASLLAVYLLGTAAGAALYHQRIAQGNTPPTGVLLAGLSAACLLGFLYIWDLAPLHATVRHALGGSVAAGMVGEFCVAMTVFALPTLLMGTTFSHLALLARERFGIGRALALNTLGGALAPPLFGVVLLPVVGTAALMLLSAIAYLPLALAVPQRRWLPVAGAGGFAGLLLLAWPPPVLDLPPGGQLIDYREGVMATTAVVENSAGTRELRVNNRFIMGATGAAISDRRQTHIPLLLHPDPRSALFLGLGTGATFAAVEPHTQTQATAVELIPELLDLLGYFGADSETVQRDPRFSLVSADARRYIRADDRSYDVIIAEVFHPSRDGAGSLYTVEHFDAIAARLEDDGLFFQWLPLFQLDIETLRSIVRSFIAVFPDAEAHLAHFSLERPLIGLAGRRSPSRYTAGWLSERVRSQVLAEDLIRVRLDSDFALFGGLLAQGDALTHFAGNAPLNTDDRPVVTYRAPEFAYAPYEPPSARVLALIDALEPRTSALGIDRDSAFGRRLAAYWQARDAFLRLGATVRPSRDTLDMLAQLREPMLVILETSSDFSPALTPLLELTRQLHRSDPGAAFELLSVVQRIAPGRPEVDRLGRRLFN